MPAYLAPSLDRKERDKRVHLMPAYLAPSLDRKERDKDDRLTRLRC